MNKGGCCTSSAIAATISASKVRVKFQLRYDFQNPFKWYNLSGLNTTVNFTNPALFGTVGTSTTSNEAGIASNGPVNPGLDAAPGDGAHRTAAGHAR